MSSSNSQKIRRNVSPSTRQGPLRATQQFGLIGGGSPSRKPVPRKTPSSSPTSKTYKHRSHSETGFVSERRSPSSPQYKVEKPKALRAGGSLESINLYLSGHWPKDGASNKTASKLDSNSHNTVSSNGIGSAFSSVTQTYYVDGVFKKDEYTQTPEDWDEVESKRLATPRSFALYKRPQSAGSGDNRNLKSKDIKARLQRKDSAGRSSHVTQTTNQPRYSPVTTLASHSSNTQPIKIPTPYSENGVLRGTPGKARASVEGLNQEVEKLIISAVNPRYNEEDTMLAPNFFEYPDGHKAPVPGCLTRSVDTQTPSQSEFSLLSLANDPVIDANDGRCSSVASSDGEADYSRPQSTSPTFTGPFDMDDPVSSLNLEKELHKPYQISPPTQPKPKRLPPDGAENLKIIDERCSVPSIKHLLTAKTLQRSEHSAFQSLLKPKPTIELSPRSALQLYD